MRKKDSAAKSKKKLATYRPLGFVAPMFSPYKGVPTYTVEYNCLLQIVVLNDLRNLYKKSINYEATLLELNKLDSLEKLAIICPDHYKKIFMDDQTTYNIDLIKKKYSDDYDFLINAIFNEITIEEYKQRYQRIIDRLNSYVLGLVKIRELINNYNAAHDFNDEEKMGGYKKIIEAYEKENLDICSKYTGQIFEVENTHPNIDESLATPKLDTNKDKRIVSLKSREVIINLFEKLTPNYVKPYINTNDLNSVIGMHFKFNDDKDNPYHKYKDEELIMWKTTCRKLIYLVRELSNEEIIDYPIEDFHILIETHFYNDYGKIPPKGKRLEQQDKIKGRFVRVDVQNNSYGMFVKGSDPPKYIRPYKGIDKTLRKILE